jgi:hypothetical protein
VSESPRGLDQRAQVRLEGPQQNMCELQGDYDPNMPCRGRPQVVCRLEGNHFSCPSLGYRETQTHQIVYRDRITPVVLEVEDCKVAPLTLDLGG